VSSFHGTRGWDLTFPPGLPLIEGGEGPLLFLFETLFAFLAQGPGRLGTMRVRGEAVRLDSFNPLALPPGLYLQVTMEDEGPARPAESLHKLFDHTGTTKGEGGHRLVLAQALILQSGGRLTVEGREDRNVVTLLLPAVKDPSPAPIREG
jgi:hypothetical protein